MINSEYKVLLNSGKEVTKRFVAGNVVRVNPEENGRPLSFDIAVNKGPNRDPEYINRIAVDREARFVDLVRDFLPGQQLFLEINVTESSKTDENGVPYKNMWLHAFEYGRTPRKYWEENQENNENQVQQ